MEKIGKLIRDKQEGYGHEKYLLNGPRLSIMRTLVNWYENPELQKIKSEYKPRDPNRKKGRVNLSAPEIEIELMSWRVAKERNEIVMNLINKSPYPLQNLTLEIVDEDDFKISLSSVTANYSAVSNDNLQIAFVPASMDSTSHTEEIRIISNSLINSKNTLTAKVSQDFPAAKETKTVEFVLNA